INFLSPLLERKNYGRLFYVTLKDEGSKQFSSFFAHMDPSASSGLQNDEEATTCPSLARREEA
ncbi:MAG: hypothetical protein LBL99_02235, partial [Holosporaceae bacterium]|nr:hypothetical protein [Holosporaceae bacterium]